MCIRDSARAVRDAVDGQRTGATNSLAAVVIKGDRLLTLPDQIFIHEIEHLEERRIRGDVARFEINELAGRVGAFLAPDFEVAVSYTHLRAHETPEHLVCRLLLEKK